MRCPLVGVKHADEWMHSQDSLHSTSYNTSSSHDESFERGCVVCVLEGEKEDEERGVCATRFP